jgi:hypothetical protein
VMPRKQSSVPSSLCSQPFCSSLDQVSGHAKRSDLGLPSLMETSADIPKATFERSQTSFFTQGLPESQSIEPHSSPFLSKAPPLYPHLTLALLEFELRVSHLLGIHSITLSHFSVSPFLCWVFSS